MASRPTIPGKWLTVSEAAQVWGRSTRTIQLWCEDGTFASSHVHTHYDSTHRGGGKWWICLPIELYSHYSQPVA